MITAPVVSTLLQFALAAFPFVTAHPHVPKALVIGGAAGKVTVTYFTVPYNPERLRGLKPGFSWHLGFAALRTEVPLEIGDAVVPPGHYKLNAKLGENGWNFELVDFQLAQAAMRAQFARGARAEQARQRYEELKKRLAGTGRDKVLAVAAEDYRAGEDEHLSMLAVLEGFTTVRRFSEEPREGVAFVLRVGFGDLHRAFSVREKFESAPGRSEQKDDGGRSRRR